METLEGKYMAKKPLDSFHSKKSAAAAQKVLSLFEHSGVFSEALLTKIFGYVWQAQDHVEHNQKEEAMACYTKFMNLLNAYSIFSTEFKTMASIYFQGIMTYENN